MKFDIPLNTNDPDDSHVEIFKSLRSFSDVFEGAKRMRVVTYCDSPEFILDLFEDLENLERLEVVVGDVDDYRERLIDKPDLADRLEQLRRDDKLVIYLCENKEVHSKLYLIEFPDVDQTDEETETDDQMTLGGEATKQSGSPAEADAAPAKVVIGSPNLSRNAWSNQTNVGVVYDTTTETNLYAQFEDLYQDHKDSYNKGGPFLEDLSEQLEQSEDDREEVIKLYTEGRVGTQDEPGEVHGRLADHIGAEVETVDLALHGKTAPNDESTQEADDAEEVAEFLEDVSDCFWSEESPLENADSLLSTLEAAASDLRLATDVRNTKSHHYLIESSAVTTPRAPTGRIGHTHRNAREFAGRRDCSASKVAYGSAVSTPV